MMNQQDFFNRSKKLLLLAKLINGFCFISLPRF
jgi:hypothetical protein